jgi:hypothetical protein
MYHLDPTDEWNCIHPRDLWIYNKLHLSRVLGYTCGPVGTSVPKPDFYIMRPSMNLLGMGRHARKEFIYKSTDYYHPSEFWCEIFNGHHISVDFYKKESKLVVLGEKEINEPYYKWKKWTKIDINVKFPEIFNELVGDYDWINCEFIGNKIIEVHFRQNPDFRYGNTEAIPVWKDENIQIMDGYRYIEDIDYLRKGFYIK